MYHFSLMDANQDDDVEVREEEGPNSEDEEDTILVGENSDEDPSDDDIDI